MNILFIIVFIVLFEVFATIGGFIMGILPNWVALTMCEVAIGFCSALLTKKLFAKKRISTISKYLCVAYTIVGIAINIYLNGFSLSHLWYNAICCVSVYISLFEIE